MQKINYLIRKTRRPVLLFSGLPIGSTENDAAEWLWQHLGINIDPTYLSTMDRASGDYATCMAIVTPESLVDLFNRALKGQGTNATARLYFEHHSLDSDGSLHALSHRG